MNLKQLISQVNPFSKSNPNPNSGMHKSSGNVMRNYAKGSSFRPEAQLRGITYKAIDKIGSSVSVYEPKVIKKNGDAYEQHPLLKLFNEPHPRDNATDFVHLWAMVNEIYGETFWYLARGEQTNKVKEIRLLNPAQVELNVHEGELVGYTLHKANGQQVPLLLDEIVHDKRANPFNPWRGMSVMEKASVYIDTEITTSVFTLNYMHNNASPSGIVSLPSMAAETFKQFTQQWREGYEGPENAGKTAFIRGGEASFKAVGATLKDVDQKITREMAKADVAMMFDIPLGLLGVRGEGGIGRSDTESLEYIFAKHKLEPMMKRLDRIYTQLIPEVTSRGDVQGAVVKHDSPVPEDREHEHTVNKDLVNVAITVNEVRERIGLPPVPGGDELNLANQEPKAPASKTKVVMKAAPTKSELDTKKAQDNESFRQELQNVNETYTVKLKRAMSKFASGQEKLVISNINASSKNYDEWLFNVKEDSEKLALLLMPILMELMEVQTKDVANFITGELITVTPEIRGLVLSRIQQISGVYNADTIAKLQATLAEGQASGESLIKLKKRVEAEFSDAKGYRAERIARTESAHTSNVTAEYTYKQNGFTTVEWFINPGACEFCRSFSGRTKEIGATYSNLGDVVTGDEGGQLAIAYADIDTPPLHPNCTCSLVPAE